jgi:hypothetical protein
MAEKAACTCCAGRVAGASGLFDLACLGCCAALVMRGHPSKQLAGSMLACIARFPGSPTRAAVLARVQALAAHARTAEPAGALQTPDPPPAAPAGPEVTPRQTATPGRDALRNRRTP